MKIYPVEGRIVRDPDSMVVLDAPRVVDDNDFFWVRRLRDGDVTTDAPTPLQRRKGPPS